ncbi:MAG: nuclear transport factor 2 family protein [Ignavibacteriae bacterium]|nr:nuclear transport factor 2 family protein [Ignavibacteriota bacterium]
MRYYLAMIFLIGLMACQQKQDIATDQKAVENTLQKFFEGITNYDYELLRFQCTAHFVLIEHGLWWNMDSLINVMKPFEGKEKTTYTFEDMKTTIEGNTAWVTYKNHGMSVMGEQETKYDWSESAFFRKQNGVWKMTLLHSTQTGSR